MKRNTLIILTLIYLTLSLLFNYSLYPLLITNEYNNQYFLLFLYFLSENISFLFLIISKKNEEILSKTLGSIIGGEESISFSIASDTGRNMTTTLNISATLISNKQPFIGMKWPSFIIPSLFDIFSKFFIFNGLKILENDIVLRSIIELGLVFCLSKLLLRSQLIRFSLSGFFVILISLIVVTFYIHISQNLKMYFEFDNNGYIGMSLCILGEIFCAIHLYFQIKYIRIGEKHCSREIAWEGLFGLILSFIVFEFSMLFPCYDKDYDNKKDLNKKFWYCCKIESVSSIDNLFQIFKNNVAWYIIYFLVSIFYNLVGLILSKYIGEIYKASIGVGRLSILLILVLFIHNNGYIGVFNCIICGIFLIAIFIGIFLSIYFGKQKDITFGETMTIHENDLKDDFDSSKINLEFNEKI